MEKLWHKNDQCECDKEPKSSDRCRFLLCLSRTGNSAIEQVEGGRIFSATHVVAVSAIRVIDLFLQVWSACLAWLASGSKESSANPASLMPMTRVRAAGFLIFFFFLSSRHLFTSHPFTPHPILDPTGWTASRLRCLSMNPDLTQWQERSRWFDGNNLDKGSPSPWKCSRDGFSPLHSPCFFLSWIPNAPKRHRPL